MNQDLTPSLVSSDAVAEFEVPATGQDPELSADARRNLEKSCVDLISKLEYLLANAREMSDVDKVDESATVGSEMVSTLASFCDQQLEGESQAQTLEEIFRCRTSCDSFEKTLKTRPIGNALMRTFWKADECPQIVSAREQLGEAISQACSRTLYHAVMRVGKDSNFGKEIDASAAEFLNEFNKAW